MIICPDCRKEVKLGAPCICGWQPVNGAFYDYLSTKDRTSAETASYIDTYNLIAERNLVAPVESDRYYENMAKRLAAILPLDGKDVCDVGSGRGFFVKHALKRARSVTAVDIAAPSLESVTRAHGVTGFLGNAENLPFERHFDVMSATDILEHVLNMGNFLITANWALRDGGTLAVRVPYRENMIGYSNFYGLPVHFTHLRTFEESLLREVVESAGFKVQKIHYDGFLPSYPWKWTPRIAIEAIRRHFGSDDDVTRISPAIGRLFMKPIEITAVAVKVLHVHTTDAYEALRKFHEARAKS
jgi:SAM-dependent methyltransferase